jgi:carboxypeptidase C (cathepsin A)
MTRLQLPPRAFVGWLIVLLLLSSETPCCKFRRRRGGGGGDGGGGIASSCSCSGGGSIYTNALRLTESPTTTTTSLSSSSYHANNNTRRRTATAKSTTTTTKSRDDYLVRDLDRIVPAFAQFPGTMYAGLIPTTTTPLETNDGNDNDSDTTAAAAAAGALMFWLFAPHEPVYDDALVVWMNGGPGCSSLGGALFEHGPVTIPLVAAGAFTTPVPPNTPLKEQLRYNEQSWTRATAMLYLEHPVGTGFSVADTTAGRSTVLNETDVARDVYGFLTNFYTIFGLSSDDAATTTTTTTTTTTDWSRKQLYLFGESYAGMYVPSVAHYIYEQNQALERNKKHDASSTEQQQHVHMPLAGIALGNGWMNALVQGPAVIDYAWWHGMIDSTTKRNLHQEWDNCKVTATDTDDSPRRHRDDQPYPFHRFTVPDECGILGAVLSAAGTGQVQWGGPNAYDVTTWDE